MKMEFIIIGIVSLAIEYCIIAYVANKLFVKRFQPAYIYLIFVGSQVIKHFLISGEITGLIITIAIPALLLFICYKRNLRGKIVFLVIYLVATVCSEIVISIILSIIYGVTLSLEQPVTLYTGYALHKLVLLILALLFLRYKNANFYISKWIKFIPIPFCVFLTLCWFFYKNYENSESFGQILALCIFGFLTCLFMIGFVQYKEEQKQTAQQLKMLRESEWFKKQWIEEREAMIRQRDRIAHDSHHHLEYVSSLNDIKVVHEYTARILSRNIFNIQITGNHDIDCILYPKQQKAQEAEIGFYVNGILPPYIEWLDPIDVVAIIGNGLANAIEACEKIESADKSINIAFRYDRHLDIRIDNPFVIAPVLKTGGFKSIKKNPGHGIGIESIQEAVDRYDGYMEPVIENGIFSLRITLQQIVPPETLPPQQAKIIEFQRDFEEALN